MESFYRATNSVLDDDAFLSAMVHALASGHYSADFPMDEQCELLLDVVSYRSRFDRFSFGFHVWFLIGALCKFVTLDECLFGSRLQLPVVWHKVMARFCHNVAL